MGRGWSKVDDILSYTASSQVYSTIIFQPIQLSFFAEAITSPNTLHHYGAIIIEGGNIVGSHGSYHNSGGTYCGAMGAIIIEGGQSVVIWDK